MLMLKEKNIPSMIYYKKPLHLQKVYRDSGYNNGDLSISEEIAEKIFSIPMHPYLSLEDQSKIVEILNHV